MAQNRAKFGYLSYQDMIQKISDGILDQHDIVFTKDTKETYIVSQDNEPIALRSRVYVYDSMTEAIREINKNNDTYVGQIISILCGDTYRGYVVNQKESLQRSTIYTVSPLTDIDSIDYNTLGNKPIINLVGTLDDPITVSQLNNGTYSIVGQYKIENSEETVYLNASPVIVIVEKGASDTTYIKKISATDIIDYNVSNGFITKSIYATDKFIEEHGYTTASYVDEKIKALDIITREEVDIYVKELVSEILDNTLDLKIDERIDLKIDEKIQPIEEESLINLF